MGYVLGQIVAGLNLHFGATLRVSKMLTKHYSPEFAIVRKSPNGPSLIITSFITSCFFTLLLLANP